MRKYCYAGMTLYDDITCAMRFNFLFINTSLLCNKQIAQQFYNNMLNDLLDNTAYIIQDVADKKRSECRIYYKNSRPCNI